MSQNTIFEYNGQSYEIDMSDVETLEKYEQSFASMQADEQKIKKDGSGAQMVKSYCEMFYHLFDRLFGDGAAVKLMGDKLNVRVCEDTYTAFLAFIRAQTAEADKRKATILSSLPSNRAQRRIHK